MKRFVLSGLTLALLAGVSSATAADIVIRHGWSSPSEVAALNVLKTGLEAKGHKWVDLALPHDTAADVGLINLITGGNPPNVFMEAAPGVYRDLMKMGLGQPLTKHFEEKGYGANLAPAVLQAITVDGEIMKVPTAVHVDGMVYYNMEVAKTAGVDPTAWKSLDEMFADFPKIREAGFIPLAIGGEQWQVGYLTHTLVAAVGGETIFPRIYAAEPDVTAFDTPEFAEVLARLRQWQQEADEGMPNRAWNDTTNMVITGKALMQIHGDWMKGEWVAAGKKAGVDFGCINIPGTKGLSVTVDAWGILGGVAPEMLEAEYAFADVVMDPAIAAEFAANKGSTPVVTNVDPASLDVCGQAVLETIREEGRAFVTPHNLTDPDWVDSIWNVMFNYWSDPSKTPEQAIEELKAEHKAIFG